MSPDCPTGKNAGKRERLVNWLVNWSELRLFLGPVKRFQFFSTTTERDRFEYPKRSRSITYRSNW